MTKKLVSIDDVPAAGSRLPAAVKTEILTFATGGSGIGPVTVTGTPTAGQVPTAVTSTTATWQTQSGGGGDPAAATHAAASKTTPVDADEFLVVDSAATFAAKKSTWANLKATLKTYFDTLYHTVGGALGTPSSGTLTNCTGLPVAGITPSTSTSLVVGNIQLGHASDCTWSRLGPGLAAIEGKLVVLMDAITVTNDTTLDIVPVVTDTSVENTGLTGAVTVTATDGQPGWKLWVALTGTASRAITWTSGDFESGAYTLTAANTTTGTQRLDAGFTWNSATSRWRLMSLSSA